jgi:hypothetical protein
MNVFHDWGIGHLRLVLFCIIVGSFLAGCHDENNDRLIWKFTIHNLRFWEGYCTGGNPITADGLVLYSGYYFWSQKPIAYAINVTTGNLYALKIN